MIEKIILDNFKCFQHAEIELENLNLFSGINGMGKSTAIQAILLLKQSILQGYMPNHISLNGDLVNIGTGADLLYENAEKENIVVSVVNHDVTYCANMKYSRNSDILDLLEYQDEITKIFDTPFEYLNAERVSPQPIYPKSSYYVNSKLQLGIHGQYTAHYLSQHQDDALSWDCCNSLETSLKGAVQYWLNEVSPNIRLNAVEIEKTDLAQIGYYYVDNEKSNTFRPTNVGFGISYILPIIVAAVKATPGSILIIENPEAHLHPRGQRRMGELLSMCASNGIQLFVETHSDHILNGIRIAVKRKVINPTDVSLLFFDKKKINCSIQHVIESPTIDKNGKLDYWPEGFFDEWDKALDEII